MIRYRVAAEALSTVLRDGAVVLNLQTKRYYSLNETGTRVWQMLGDDTAPPEIAATLTREFDVEDEEARCAVQQLLDELLRERLIVPEHR